ncbi:hypothetical protein E4U57_008032 [Claviceps arundinis]|uniref:Uncharacterized protein n=1 Tax=Claviceps arundinis TaxID=1623583 RepID=A0ABQ7PDY6_9HYPO|nr:hypothetical protein E4U57_008032 [Claviceps arundinis]
MSSAYTNEYGRRYAVFGDVQYPFPMDEMEQSREDMKHAMLLILENPCPAIIGQSLHPPEVG